MEINGTRCQYSCNTLRGIKMHRRIKHRVRNSVAMATVTNQCLFLLQCVCNKMVCHRSYDSFIEKRSLSLRCSET
jgi:hypothetical protein